MRSLQVGQNLIDNYKLNEAYTMVEGTTAWALAGLRFDHKLTNLIT
jgi:hypothetical protein